MPHDPARVEDSRAWLTKAKSDLDAASHDLKASPPLLADLVFHCQQAAEKAMKGLLAWHDIPFRKSHDLEEIGESCLSIDASLKDLVEQAVPLTEYAWKFRYPGEPDEPTQTEAEEALALARLVFKAILARLPEEVKPRTSNDGATS
jgi:HEPN domain-containing protein